MLRFPFLNILTKADLKACPVPSPKLEDSFVSACLVVIESPIAGQQLLRAILKKHCTTSFRLLSKGLVANFFICKFFEYS